MKHNKLVRDNIPEILEKIGKDPVIRIVENDEYNLVLKNKLEEEVGEFLVDDTLEELADVLEVVYALSDALGYSREELECCRQEKKTARGGFKKGVFLIKTSH